MIRVLHVSIDEERQRMLRISLERSDYEISIDIATTPTEILSKLSEDYQCIILDHDPPKIDGFQLSEALKKAGSPPIILLLKEKAMDVNGSYADDFVQYDDKTEGFDLASRINFLTRKRSKYDDVCASLNIYKRAFAYVQDGSIQYLNTKMENLTGWKMGELVNKPQSQLVSSDDNKDSLLLRDRSGHLINSRGKIEHISFGESNGSLIIARTQIESINEINDFLQKHASELISCLDKSSMVEKIMDALSEVSEAEQISIYLIDGSELILSAQRFSPGKITLPITAKSPSSVAARQGKSVLASDLSDFKEGVIDFEPRSELSVPVKGGESVIAVLSLKSSKLGAFTREQQILIEAFSTLVGFSLSILKEIKVAESAEFKYGSLLESLSDPIFVISDSRYVYVNKRGANMLGYADPLELVGIDAYKHVAFETREDVIGHIIKLEKGKVETEYYETTLLRYDGSRINVEARASRINFGGRLATLIIIKDITAQKKTQEELKKYTEELKILVDKRTNELIEAEQMAAAGKLASTVGHDLRSPLQSIKNALYVMQKQPSKSTDMIASIESSVDRALVMLDELRQKTRDTPLKLERINVKELIEESLRDVPMPDSITLEKIVDANIKPQMLDPLKMRRVLDNMARNAVEAMPMGGRLRIHAKIEGEELLVIISDTGVGIPADKIDQLFKPFYTTKQKGLGLGLVFCQKAIESHGGRIIVNSREGVGTTFTLYIPIMQGKQGRETPSE